MIYPFICNKCNTEYTVSIPALAYGKDRETFCPRCGSKDTKRTFYSDGISIQFKGKDFTKSVKEER